MSIAYSCIDALNNRVMTTFGSIIIFLLFTSDIGMWVIGFNIVNTAPRCKETICVDVFLVCSGMLSMYINFFRLWDLAHLYAAIGEQITVGSAHYIFRLTYEATNFGFHVICAILAFYLVFATRSKTEQQIAMQGYDKNSISFVLITNIVTNLCYILISILVARLKYVYLRRERLLLNEQQ